MSAYNMMMREADKAFAHAQNAIDHSDYHNAAAWIAQAVVNIDKAINSTPYEKRCGGLPEIDWPEEMPPDTFRQLVEQQIALRCAKEAA